MTRAGRTAPSRCRGAIMFVLLAVFFTIAILAAATYFFSRMERNATISSNVDSTLQNLQTALVTYVAAHGYLPCPADGTAGTGSANPSGPTAVCASPSGTVPWVDLNLAQSDALDPWGRLISYRVYDGANVGLTDNLDHSTSDPPSLGYASMVNCNTAAPSTGTATWNGVCSAQYNNTAAQFLAGKTGLTISDNNGNLQPGIAFALISHGPTGYGAWLPGGQRMTLPPAGGDEYLNTQAGGTYYAQPATDPTVAPDNVNHFDDRVAFLSISDLMNKAGLAARPWTVLPVSGFNATTTLNMNVSGAGHFITQNSGGDSFQAASNGTQLIFGVSGGSYSACAWSPTAVNLYQAGATGYKNRLIVYVEAAFDSGNPGEGFTLAFLPTDGYTVGSSIAALYAPTNSSCGSPGDPGAIGWGDANLTNSTIDGTLPTPRFAVELDVDSEAVRDDPANNHVALDFNGTTHDGTLASRCSASASTYHTTGVFVHFPDCYTSGSATSLASGIANFHRMRVEVVPNSASCGGGAPQVLFWLLPYSTCNPAAGSAPPDCVNIQNVTQAYTPASFPSSGVVLSQCVPSPTPSDAFNSVYFGFTAAVNSRGTSQSTANLTLQNLQSGLIPTP